jgi:hypothetical protein
MLSLHADILPYLDLRLVRGKSDAIFNGVSDRALDSCHSFAMEDSGAEDIQMRLRCKPIIFAF